MIFTSVTIGVFQGTEVDLNTLKQMSSEYAEAKKLAINGTVFSMD